MGLPGKWIIPTGIPSPSQRQIEQVLYTELREHREKAQV